MRISFPLPGPLPGAARRLASDTGFAPAKECRIKKLARIAARNAAPLTRNLQRAGFDLSLPRAKARKELGRGKAQHSRRASLSLGVDWGWGPKRRRNLWFRV